MVSNEHPVRLSGNLSILGADSGSVPLFRWQIPLFSLKAYLDPLVFRDEYGSIPLLIVLGERCVIVF